MFGGGMMGSMFNGIRNYMMISWMMNMFGFGGNS